MVEQNRENLEYEQVESIRKICSDIRCIFERNAIEVSSLFDGFPAGCCGNVSMVLEFYPYSICTNF